MSRRQPIVLSLLAAVWGLAPLAVLAQSRPQDTGLLSLDAQLDALSRRVAPSVVQVVASGYTSTPRASAGARPGLGLRRDRRRRRVDRHERPRGRGRAQRARRPAAARGAAVGRIDPAAAQPARSPRASWASTARRTWRCSRSRSAACRPSSSATRSAAAGTAGDGLRQPAGARELGEPGSRERGRAAAEARRPDDLRADRRLDQPGQQRRAARRRRGPHGRAQHDDPLAVGRQRGHRLRRAEQHRALGLRADCARAAGCAAASSACARRRSPPRSPRGSGSSSTAASCSPT